MEQIEEFCSNSRIMQNTRAWLMRAKRFLLAITFYAITCGFLAESGAIPVKVGIADHTVSQVALYVSRDKGYFASDGAFIRYTIWC